MEEITPEHLINQNENYNQKSERENSTNRSFSYKLSNKFEDLDLEKEEEVDDIYDTNGRKKTVKNEESGFLANESPFNIGGQISQRLGGFEDMVNKVRIDESEVHNFEETLSQTKTLPFVQPVAPESESERYSYSKMENYLSFSNQNFNKNFEEEEQKDEKNTQTDFLVTTPKKKIEMKDKSSSAKIPEKRLQRINLEIQMINSQLEHGIEEKNNVKNFGKSSKSGEIIGNLLEKIDNLSHKLDIRSSTENFTNNSQKSAEFEKSENFQNFPKNENFDNFKKIENFESFSPDKSSTVTDQERMIRIQQTTDRIDYYGTKIDDLISRMDRLYEINTENFEENEILQSSPNHHNNSTSLHCSAQSGNQKIELKISKLEKILNSEIYKKLGDNKIKIEVKYMKNLKSKPNSPQKSPEKISDFSLKNSQENYTNFKRSENEIPPPRSKKIFLKKFNKEYFSEEEEINELMDSEEFGIMVNEIVEEGLKLSKERGVSSEDVYNNTFHHNFYDNFYDEESEISHFKNHENFGKKGDFKENSQNFSYDNGSNLRVYLSRNDRDNNKKGLVMDIYTGTRTLDQKNLQEKIYKKSSKKIYKEKIPQYQEKSHIFSSPTSANNNSRIIRIRECSESPSFSHTSRYSRIISPPQNTSVRTQSPKKIIKKIYTNSPLNQNQPQKIIKEIVEPKTYTRIEKKNYISSLANPIPCLILFSKLQNSLIDLETSKKNFEKFELKKKVFEFLTEFKKIIENFLLEYQPIYKEVKNLLRNQDKNLTIFDLEQSLFNSKTSTGLDDFYLNKEADLILIHSKFSRILYKVNKNLKKSENLYNQSQNFEKKNQKYFLIGIFEIIEEGIKKLGKASKEVIKSYLEAVGETSDIFSKEKFVKENFKKISIKDLGFCMASLGYDWDSEIKNDIKEDIRDEIAKDKKRNFEITEGFFIQKSPKSAKKNFNIFGEKSDFYPISEKTGYENFDKKSNIFKNFEKSEFLNIDRTNINPVNSINIEGIGQGDLLKKLSKKNLEENQRIKESIDKSLDVRKTDISPDFGKNNQRNFIVQNSPNVISAYINPPPSYFPTTIKKPENFDIKTLKNFEKNPYTVKKSKIENPKIFPKTEQKPIFENKPEIKIIKKSRNRVNILKAKGTITALRLLSSNGNMAVGFNTGELVFFNLKNKEKIQKEKNTISGHSQIEECSKAHKSAINSMEVMWVYFGDENKKTEEEKNFMVDSSTNNEKKFLEEKNLKFSDPGKKPKKKKKNFLKGMRKILLTGGSESECSIIVWDLKSRKPVKRLSGHKHLISSIQDLGDYSHVATSSFDSKIAIWDIKNNFHCKKVIEIHDSPILHLNFSTKKKEIIAGFMDGNVVRLKIDFIEKKNFFEENLKKIENCEKVQENFFVNNSSDDNESTERSIFKKELRSLIFNDVKKIGEFRVKSHIVKIEIFEDWIFILGSNFLVDIYNLSGEKIGSFYSEFPVVDFCVEKKLKNLEKNFSFKNSESEKNEFFKKKIEKNEVFENFENLEKSKKLKLVVVDNRNNMICYDLGGEIKKINYPICLYETNNFKKKKIKAEVNNFFGCNPKTQIWKNGDKKIFVLKDEEKKNLILQEF